MNSIENSMQSRYTEENYEYDSDYTTCYAVLSITGKNLDFGIINSMLNCRKYSVYRHGVISKKGGVLLFLPGKNKVSVWTYSTKEQSVKTDLRECVERLRKRFSKSTEELKSIRKMYPNCRITVGLAVYNHQRALPAISLTAKQIEFLCEIGADFDIDLYN